METSCLANEESGQKILLLVLLHTRVACWPNKYNEHRSINRSSSSNLSTGRPAKSWGALEEEEEEEEEEDDNEEEG